MVTMPEIDYKLMSSRDIPILAEIRANNSESKEYWFRRISNYYQGLSHPQQALLPRVIFIASDKLKIVGFIAGHLSKRYDCEGELEWIDVIEEYRRKGIASDLVKVLAKWFIDHHVYKICADPENQNSRDFYRKNGATNLNQHWMYWNDIRAIL